MGFRDFSPATCCDRIGTRVSLIWQVVASQLMWRGNIWVSILLDISSVSQAEFFTFHFLFGPRQLDIGHRHDLCRLSFLFGVVDIGLRP
jgi:hypothetical protein